MGAKHSDKAAEKFESAPAEDNSSGFVSAVSHTAGDVGGSLLEATEKVRDATTSAAHDVAKAARDAGGKLRDVTDTATHAAASAKGTVAGRAQVALRGNGRRIGTVAAAAASAAFAVLAALIARRGRD